MACPVEAIGDDGQIAFDDIAVKPRIGERISFVRAEIFDGVEFSADVKKRDFRAVF
jgi:hypothetical protein